MSEKEIRMEQVTIHIDLLESYQNAGWGYIGQLPDKRVVVERPLGESKPINIDDKRDDRKYFK